MRALIMAGGSGSRLARGEKPLTLILGKPMISYITDAFCSAGCEPVVVTSLKTPMTANWCRAHGIATIRSKGRGYIEDMTDSIRNLEEEAPLFISVSDIPCITPDIVTTIHQSYEDCGKDALSTWIPAYRVTSCRGSMPFHEQVRGTDACPAGVNILTGENCEDEQDEFRLLLDDPRLGLNVNTLDDLARTETFLLANTAR